jgi:hypothetical protein
VTSAAFSPDGAYVVTGSYDKTAKIWDASTGAEKRNLAGHSDGVFSAAFSPDGAYVVTGSGDSTAKIWFLGTITGFDVPAPTSPKATPTPIPTPIPTPTVVCTLLVFNASGAEGCAESSREDCEHLASAGVVTEEDTACEGLCLQAYELQHAVTDLYRVNFADMLIEFLSCFAVIGIYLSEKRSIYVRLLLVVFLADIALQIWALVVAFGVGPVVRDVLDAACINGALQSGLRSRDLLVGIAADVQKSVTTGGIELIAAIVGMCFDANLFCKPDSDPDSCSRMCIILMALLDAVLSSVDFFVFSLSATSQFTEFFYSLRAAGGEWCVVAEAVGACSS